MVRISVVNCFAGQKFLNDIKNPAMKDDEKRKKDVDMFLKYLSTPKTESEIKTLLEMLLNSEHARTMESISIDSEPKKVYVNEQKRTVAVLWKDGTVTKAKCHENDYFDLSVGYSICYFKHKEKMSNKTREDFFKNVLPSITEYHKEDAKKVKTTKSAVEIPGFVGGTACVTNGVKTAKKTTKTSNSTKKTTKTA